MLKPYFPYYRRLLKLAMPLVLTQAGQTMVHLIDNAMVGRVGTADLAAASFANSIFVVIMVFGMGIYFGITPLIGHALGAGDDKKVAFILKNSFALSTVFITMMTLITWSFIWIMPYMGQTEEVVRLSIPYYKTLTLSLIPFLIFILFKQIGEGLGNTMLAMAATILSNVLNVLLNYALIFGKFGCPELGLLGAGYATLISRITMPFLLYFGFKATKSINRYFNLMTDVKIAVQEIKEIFRVGFPIAGQLIVEVFSFAFSAVMMGWLGNVPLAAHQVALGMASFTFMMANGVAMAATIRVSYQLGQKNFDSMEKVSYSAIHLVLAYMALCGIALYAFRYQLPKLFTADELVIEQAASLLIIAAIFQIFDGLQIVSLGILRGFADVKAPMYIASFSYLAVGLSIGYLSAFHLNMGPEGIWYGFVAGLLCAGIFLAFRIRKNIRRVEGLTNSE